MKMLNGLFSELVNIGFCNVQQSPALQSLEFIRSVNPHRYKSLPSHVNKGRSEYLNDTN